MYSPQTFLPNFMPSACMLPNKNLSMNFNRPAPYPLMTNFLQMPLNYAPLPTMAPQMMPNMTSDPLSMLKLQNQYLVQMSALHSANIQKIQQSPLFYDPIKLNASTCSPSLKAISDNESPIETLKIEPQPEVKPSIIGGLGLPNDPDICFEAQIKYMVQFFVNSFGTATNQEIRQTKQKYAANPQLLQAFEALESKYTITTKTREEMVKWVIRRCLKITKATIKKGQKKDQKQALKDLCTRYFDVNGGDDEEDEDNEVADRVLPFRKNSKNRTMNSQFVTEIFQSEEFKNDYKEFIKNMDEIIDKENTEKINKLTSFIFKCSKKQDFGGITKYKRIPWLKLWLENTKRVAEELNEGNYEGKGAKKMKTN